MGVENRGRTGCSLEGDREWQNDRTSCIQRARRSSKKKSVKKQRCYIGRHRTMGIQQKLESGRMMVFLA